MMKICIITSMRSKCGIGQYSREFIQFLIRNLENKTKVIVITHRDSDIFLSGVKIYKVIEEFNPTYFRKIDSIIKQEKPNLIDIEWEHNIYSPLVFLGGFIYPIIFKYRDNIFLSMHSMYKERDVYNLYKDKMKYLSYFASKYYQANKKFLINTARVIRVFSHYELSQVANRKNVVLIRQGFSPCEPLKIYKNRNKFNLLIFGFIRDNKDYKLALESLRNIDRRFNLIIAGKPQSQIVLSEIKRIIKKLKVKDRVKLILGFLSDNDKRKLFEKSKIILIPYKIISNSGVIIDSIKYCRPLVSTVLEEDIKNLNIGLFSNRTHEEFIQAIYNITENYNEYYESILRARKNFYWPLIVRKIIKIYKSML